MAPSPRLVKRLALETQPLSKSMIGAIAGGAVFIVLFIIALGVFVWFYIRSSPVPYKRPYGIPSESSDSSTANVLATEKEEVGSSSLDSSAAPTPAFLPTSLTAPEPAAFVGHAPPPTGRSSTVSTSSQTSPNLQLPVGPTRRKSSSLEPTKDGDATRESVASSQSLTTALPTPGVEMV